MRSRGFVPRAPQTRRVGPRVGWDAALVGWSRTGWAVTATEWSALADPQRRALVAVARRFTKKVATTVVARHPGAVVTGRPVGTRMGKGKGKPTGHRGWLPQGAALLRVTGTPRGLSVLEGRSSSRVVVLPVGW